jgi:hypothetical protein
MKWDCQNAKRLSLNFIAADRVNPLLAITGRRQPVPYLIKHRLPIVKGIIFPAAD